jgi:hypothetical protein
MEGHQPEAMMEFPAKALEIIFDALLNKKAILYNIVYVFFV